MQNSIETNDNIFDIFQMETKLTQLVEEAERVDYLRRNVQLAASIPDRLYLGINFRAHNQQTVYKRQTYDMLTFLADLGGGYDLLIIVFGSICGVLTTN